MKKQLKLLTIIAGFAVAAVIASIGAYYVGDDAMENTFTVGEIAIALSEPGWNEDSASELVPGENVTKDPLVENTGENPAFVFIEVRIPKKDIYTYDPATNARSSTTSDVQLFDLKGISSDWVLLNSDTSDEDKNIYVYAYGTSSACLPLARGERTTSLFTSVDYCYAVEGQDLDEKTQTIDITAYAIQADEIKDNDSDAASPAAVWSILRSQIQ